MAKFLKELITSELKSWDGDLDGSIMVDFLSLTAEESNDLRRQLRSSGLRMNVVPNKLYRLALKEKAPQLCEKEEINVLFDGPTAVVQGEEHAIEAAKILVDWRKNNDKLKIKGGFVDREIILEKDVEALAQIPGKDVLLGQVVGGFASPLRGTVGVLSNVLRSLLYAFNAIKDKKEETS